MEQTVLGTGFGVFDGLTDYHYTAFEAGRLTLIGRNYVAQPAFNWGHRVAFSGSYALNFDEVTEGWVKTEFPALSTIENLEETVFTADGKLYVLLYTNFGAIEFKGLHRWDATEFTDITGKMPEIINFEPTHRVEFSAAQGLTADGRVVIFTNDDNANIKVYGVSIESGDIELLATIDAEVNQMRGKPVSGGVVGNKVLISYGVHGCGFMWQSDRFIMLDLSNNHSEAITLNAEYETLPKFSFVGPSCVGVDAESGSWIAATGSTQVGMTGSKYNGSVWALKGIFNNPSEAQWVQLKGEIPEGEIALDDKTIYSASKEKVVKFEFNL